MSVDYKTYIIYGVDIGYDIYKQYEDEYELYDSKHIIVDGMCGGYCYFGYILGEIKYDTSKHKEINTIDFENAKLDIMSELDEKFGIDVEPKLIMFNHYY